MDNVQAFLEAKEALIRLNRAIMLFTKLSPQFTGDVAIAHEIGKELGNLCAFFGVSEQELK